MDEITTNAPRATIALPADEMERSDLSARRSWAIVLAALLAAVLLYYVLPFGAAPRKGLALLLFVAVLWLTEAIHVTITAILIPVGALALGFSGVDTKRALASFGDPIIFLFFGGFALSTALRVQKLDRKIAVWLMSLADAHLGVVALLLFVVTALLSMWISNTATVAMMLPLVLGVLSTLDCQKDRNAFTFVLLGIAYAASIGGLGTLVGSPPNAIAAKALNLNFADWMMFGLPLVLVLLPLMVLALWLVLRPDLSRSVELARDTIDWTPQRVLTMLVFAATALAWMLGDWVAEALNISSQDTFIALAAAAAIAILRLASWRQIAENTDWGVLFLFGGGLALSDLLKTSGAAAVLGEQMGALLGGAHPLLVILGVALFIAVLTEFASNTASAALLVPVFAAVARQMGMAETALVLIIGVGASCAFMLPVATPPNAIVFGTGHIRQRDMLRAGGLLNGFCVLLLGLWGYFVLL
ncbi:MAG: DASS family sodium-coupled anion symporter [Rhodocyclaceae bacterium]|nr:DASS family sodium-coupled anion symporter [Rhodocyclaceae bacterium]